MHAANRMLQSSSDLAGEGLNHVSSLKLLSTFVLLGVPLALDLRIQNFGPFSICHMIV